MTGTYQPQQVRGRWTILALSYLVMVVFGFVLQALPPLFQLLTADIPFSHVFEGLLMGAFGIPGLFVPTIGAGLLQRTDPRKVLIGGLAVVVAGVALFAVAGSYSLLFAARLIQGCGGMTLVMAAPLLVNEAFDKDKIGRVIGFFNTGVPLGIVLATLFFSRIGSHAGWRVSMAIAGGTAAVSIMLICFLLPSGLSKREGGARKESPGGVGMGRAIFLMGLVNLLVNAGTAPFGTFAPQFFSSVGVTAGKASLIISLMMIETTVLGPFIGILVDRIRNHRILLASAGLLIAVGFGLLLMPGIPLVAGPLLLGAATAIVPVTMFPFLNEMVPAERVAGGLAVLVTASNIGNNVGLGVFGFVLDRAGIYEPCFAILGIFGLLICPVVLKIRRKPAEPEFALEA